MRLIFETDNDISTKVRWLCNGSGGLQAKNVHLTGICAAMCVSWIKNSLELGDGIITSAAQLGKPHHMAILQAAFMRGTIPLTRGRNEPGLGIDLLRCRNLDVTHYVKRAECFSILPAKEAISTQGHCMFFIYGTQNGHAMAVRNTGDIHLLFDPSIGCYRFDTKGEMFSEVSNLLSGKYKLTFTQLWEAYHI